MPLPLTREAFARLFAENHRRIFGYVRSMLPHAADAEEVFQETCVVLWREFESYDPSRSFAPWALAIARNQVRSHRHRYRRERQLFSDALVDELSEQEQAMSPELARRSEALTACIQKLSPRDRQLLAEQYGTAGAGDRRTIRELAEQLGRPVNTLYKALRRIRAALVACVDRRLLAEERAAEQRAADARGGIR